MARSGSSDGGGGSCPSVWKSVASSLQKLYLGSDGQCNDDARAAIRLAFHDCGTWDLSQGPTGGCDGSLVNTIGLTTSTNGVPDRELSRPENGFLTDISLKMISLQKTFPSVTMADLISFGAAVAIVTCPGGPQIQTFVGRKDSMNPAKPGGLPNVHADADSLFKLFEAKGFDAKGLAALLGAHSTSKGFGQTDIMKSGTPQDGTPGLWDVKYYQDTLTPPTGCVPFPSDTSLAAHPVVGKEFHGFIGRQSKWAGDFGSAMTKMTLLGVPGGANSLIDCTSAVPRGTNNKRDMRAAPINDRVR
ncbi:heme peroxidase [Hyaloscypha finlandica]|nr:heme peroxidase [Hyaloscypha finlandica]